MTSPMWSWILHPIVLSLFMPGGKAMQAIDLQALLKNCPYPITWHHFQSEQQLPFAVWKEDESDNITSDLSMLRLRDTFTIDFYYESWSQKKAFEEYLTSLPLLWQRNTSDLWISSEQMYLSSYSIEVTA